MTEVGEFDQIAGLNELAQAFMSAAGIEDLKSLAAASAQEVHEEICGAREMLHIEGEIPSIDEISGWISSAQRMVEDLLGEASEEPEVILNKPKKVITPSVANAPQAIPIDVSFLVEQQIAVNDVPVMVSFLSEESEPISEGAAKQARPGDVVIRSLTSDLLPPQRYTGEREHGEKADIQPLERGLSDIRKTPSEMLNKGKKAHARSFIRGVLHPQPTLVRFGALVTACLLVVLPMSFIAGCLILAKVEHWFWYSIIPGLGFTLGAFYFMFARGLKCRVCGQPIFTSKRCLRHEKAHHVPLLGNILPTCLHILFFHWFRCMYCGTSVRIRE
jgi:hypothetical protein